MPRWREALRALPPQLLCLAWLACSCTLASAAQQLVVCPGSGGTIPVAGTGELQLQTTLSRADQVPKRNWECSFIFGTVDGETHVNLQAMDGDPGLTWACELSMLAFFLCEPSVKASYLI